MKMKPRINRIGEGGRNPATERKNEGKVGTQRNVQIPTSRVHLNVNLVYMLTKGARSQQDIERKRENTQIESGKAALNSLVMYCCLS